MTLIARVVFVELFRRLSSGQQGPLIGDERFTHTSRHWKVGQWISRCATSYVLTYQEVRIRIYTENGRC